MLALAFFHWWYGLGWLRLGRGVRQSIVQVDRTFSVPILLRTLFAPWRRIISHGDNIIENAKAVLDNTVSRFVGFSVRIIVLFIAAGMMLVIAAAGLLLLITWPFVPFLAIGLVLWGLFS